jgi:biopolymer transport protein ExbD
MNIVSHTRRSSDASLIPMINVVFLLLIFFLLAAQIRTPDPIEVSAPVSISEMVSDGELTLFIGADGQMKFGDISGPERLEQALIAICQKQDCPSINVRVKADRAADAAVVAGLLPVLARAGFGSAEFVTAPQ